MFVYVGIDKGGCAEDGIGVYRLDRQSGRMDLVETVYFARPAYVAVSPTRRTLYATSRGDGEGRGDALAAFSIDAASGRLTFLNQTSIPSNPSYVSLDQTQSVALFTCAFGGVAGVARLLADGSLGETHTLPHPGVSLSAQGLGQSSIGHVKWSYGNTPLPHSVRMSPDNRIAFVPDVGMNRVFLYRLDVEAGQLTPNDPPWAQGVPIDKPWLRDSNPAWDRPDGAGPRHMEFHPNGRWLYVDHEAGSLVTLFHYDAGPGRLELIQTISTLPDDFVGSSSPSDIHVHPSGRFVYVANRRHDTIVSYAVDPENGRLTLLGFTPTAGENVRNFLIAPDGALLLLAAMGSERIVAFAIDQATGALRPNGAVTEVAAPACLALLDK
jgi:6-phosphogluconolactonase